MASKRAVICNNHTVPGTYSALSDVAHDCHIRGLGFKFVDFLYKSSDVCYTEIKMISSENIFFYLSYKLLSIALLIIVSTQQ